MAGYYPSSCDTEIGEHACDPCEDREFGRVRSAGFISSTAIAAILADPTNPTIWAAAMQDRTIIVVPETNGEVGAPSEKMSTGYGETTETLLGYDFTAMFNDPNWTSNADFYNSLVGKRDFYFFYRTSSKVSITPVTVTIIPKMAVANDLNAEVTWNINVKWTANRFPVPFETPDGIFDTCFIPA